MFPAPNRILIAHDLAEPLGELIRAARPDLELRALPLANVGPDDVAWAEALVGFRRPAVGVGRVRWVHCIGAGVDAWTIPPLPSGVLLTRTDESFAAPIGEWVVARLLEVTQQLRRLQRSQLAHQWDEFTPRPLTGTHAVVLGTGDVGAGIATRLQALGVRVTGISRTGTARRGFAEVRGLNALQAALPGTDWLIIALPLTDETRYIVNRSILHGAAGAWLVNVGRGGLVDEQALITALQEGTLAGAALDVFTIEPLPGDSPLWDRPNVIVSPHIAGVTTPQGAADGFLRALDAIERGGRPPRVVDPTSGY